MSSLGDEDTNSYASCHSDEVSASDEDDDQFEFDTQAKKRCNDPERAENREGKHK